MSRDKEYFVKKTRGFGSRSGMSSKSSFPPSYFTSTNGISSNLNKLSLKDAMDTSGFNLSAKKKVKPRRSMLGRRTKIFSQNYDTDSSNSMRPLYSSSPKDEIERNLVTPQIHKNKSSPSHPFDLNTSSYFENGASSNFSTWSIFKKGNVRKPLSPGKASKALTQNAMLDVPKYNKKMFNPDNSLGMIPLDSLSPTVETENVITLSAFKNKKLSVVKEETETLPVINKSDIELERIVEENELKENVSKNLCKLIENWFNAKENWDKSRKQLEKDTQKMNEVNHEIIQILKSQTDELSNTLVSDKIEINKENENPTQYSASKNDLVDTIYGEFKSRYSLLQSPSALSSIKKKPINSLCYTPNSLSSCVKQQIKLIYGNDD